MPLIVKNPMTNEIIVGEVEYYLIKNDNLSYSQFQLQNQIPESNQQDLTTEVTAVFIGTDYNYAVSSEFRNTFITNSMDHEHIKMQLGAEINKKLAND